MKFIIALACSVLFVAVAPTCPRKNMKAMFKTCCDENNATRSNLLGAIFDRELPSDRESHCALGCIYMESGVLLPNLTLNVTIYNWALTHIHHLPQENATEIVKICSDSLTGITDRCDAGAALFSCAVDNISEEN